MRHKSRLKSAAVASAVYENGEKGAWDSTKERKRENLSEEMEVQQRGEMEG